MAYICRSYREKWSTSLKHGVFAKNLNHFPSSHSQYFHHTHTHTHAKSVRRTHGVILSSRALSLTYLATSDISRQHAVIQHDLTVYFGRFLQSSAAWTAKGPFCFTDPFFLQVRALCSIDILEMYTTLFHRNMIAVLRNKKKQRKIITCHGKSDSLNPVVV